jgi:low temperature requirement protein LtrA
VFAVGASYLVQHVDASMPEAHRLVLCGGVAMYLVGHVAFRLRMVGVLGYEKAIVAAALIVLYALGGELPAWSVAAAITALLVALCVVEAREVPE